VTGFKGDILKASGLAVLTVILLGAAVFLFSPQVEKTPEPVPQPLATVDTYTEKGGYGPNIVSDFHLYNENVSIYASVKDASNQPIVNTTVTFEIHGPPSSNITLTQTSQTNSSGVAVATIPAPSQIGQPETVLGIWTAVATAEIEGTTVTDSIAFEVKAPPSPFIDVYTDRGGNGSNVPSQPYSPDNKVNLYANVNNGTSPLSGTQVTFAVYGPNTPPYFSSNVSNASGIATFSFRTPGDPAASIGTWRVIVTVQIEDQVFIDALTFECTSPT